VELTVAASKDPGRELKTGSKQAEKLEVLAPAMAKDLLVK
jgi:hypothetical protein